MADEELARIRQALAEADSALVRALDARARAVKSYVSLREAHPDAYASLPSAAEVIRAAREAASDFPEEPLELVLREVLGACARIVAPVRVALVGSDAGFARLAARRHFGSSAEIVTHSSVAAVFDDVERKRASFGVAPFETSTDGAMTETLHALVAGEARVCAEITVACTHDLVSKTGNAGDVEKIYGTVDAIKACERSIEEHFGRATVLDVLSGAVAEELALEDHGAAAVIAGWSDEDARGLRRVRARIEDRVGIETRYVIIGHERPAKTGRDRTILALGVSDAPGSLYAALQPFADRGINLTRLESRTASGAAWRYLFLLELDGHVTDRAVLTAVEAVRSASRHLKVLGSYPRPA